MPPKKEVSLLPNADNNQTFFARTLRWLTTVGRVVLIFTELIVIGAFLSRFWLDRKNADLSETIRQQKAILTSTKEFEKDFISLQTRLDFIHNFYQKQPNYIPALNSLVESLPDGIFFQTLTMAHNDDKDPKTTAKVELYAYQEEVIVDFISNLKLNPQVSSLDVQRIEKKTKDSKYYLTIFLTFNSNVPLS